MKRPGGSQRDMARCVPSDGGKKDRKKRHKWEGREREPERTNSIA